VSVTSNSVSLLVHQLDLFGALNISARLNALPESTAYQIDFSGMSWVEPFGMLFFASQLRRFRAAHVAARFKAIGYEHHGYPAHMGFFQAFGLDYGKDPGEAKGSLQYIPITAIVIRELESEERKLGYVGHDIRDVLEHRCERLVQVLTRGGSGDLRNTLIYSLREIFRNVVEHSRADTIWFSAQHWPETGLVELSILDEGIGIRASLSRNPYLKINDDSDALRFAVLPGISGIAYKGGPKQRNDPWANSGYGLFMTSQLCAAGGTFVICSGDECMIMEHNKQEFAKCNFRGTALRLTISTDAIKSLSATLEMLRKRGNAIVRELKMNANITASMSARMLSKDFNT